MSTYDRLIVDLKLKNFFHLVRMVYHIYSIESHDPSIPETYTGITRDLDLITYHHGECSDDGQSYLYTFIRSHGGWKNFFVKQLTSHETYEEARDKKVSGKLNIYDLSIINVPTIYKIFCRDPKVSQIYVGQTTNFDSRRYSHCFASLYRHLKLYEFIRSHGGWPNWKMVRIREYPFCKDKEELDRLEWYWWHKLDADLNSITPGHKPDIEKFKDKLIYKMEEFERMVIDDVPRKNFLINSISLEI